MIMSFTVTFKSGSDAFKMFDLKNNEYVRSEGSSGVNTTAQKLRFEGVAELRATKKYSCKTVVCTTDLGEEGDLQLQN